jgi:hypothetical protein
MGSLRSGAGRAGFEARKFARIQAEQVKLSRLQGQKRDHLLALGEALWVLYENGEVTDPRLIGICRDIEQIARQIADQESLIEQVRQEQPPEPPKCPACGRQVSGDEAFCPGCGARLTQPSPTPAPAAAEAICPNCGTSVRPGASFCRNCGHRLSGGG